MTAISINLHIILLLLLLGINIALAMALVLTIKLVRFSKRQMYSTHKKRKKSVVSEHGIATIYEEFDGPEGTRDKLSPDNHNIPETNKTQSSANDIEMKPYNIYGPNTPVV